MSKRIENLNDINSDYSVDRHSTLRGQYLGGETTISNYTNKHKTESAFDNGETYVGWTVSLCNNKAISVEARYTNPAHGGGNGNHGAILLYEKTGDDWGTVTETRLTSSTWVNGISLYMGTDYTKGGSWHGYRSQGASIYNDRVVAGSPLFHNGTVYRGEIIIWEKVGSIWNETHISASNLESGDEFGAAVSTNGDWIAVGARDHSPSYEGVVYMFLTTSAGWVSSSVENPLSSGNYGAEFGASVYLTGSKLAVGAPGKDKVFIFNSGSTSWDLEATIDHPSSSTGELFGVRVALHNDTVAIGAPGNDVGGSNAGAVYLYASGSSGWYFKQGIAGDQAGAQFGSAIDIGNNHMIIGAEVYDSPGSGGSNDGKAWLYESGSTYWTLAQTYEPDAKNSSEAPQMGSSVAINGDALVIGSKYEVDSLSDKGLTYVYDPTVTTTVKDSEPKMSAGSVSVFNLRKRPLTSPYKLTL